MPAYDAANAVAIGACAVYMLRLHLLLKCYFSVGADSVYADTAYVLLTCAVPYSC